MENKMEVMECKISLSQLRMIVMIATADSQIDGAPPFCVCLYERLNCFNKNLFRKFLETGIKDEFFNPNTTRERLLSIVGKFYIGEFR